MWPKYHTYLTSHILEVYKQKIILTQTYGKGTAADCRRHVQKLNMMRAEKEQLENEQLQSSSSPCSHPPEDYADTFTAQDKPAEEIVRVGRDSHYEPLPL